MRLALGCVLLLLVASLESRGDDLAKELPRIPPRSPADALQSFLLVPGFQLRLVACEPDVTDPIAACFDAAGRLYVVEMGDYPFEAGRPGGCIKRLEDRDGDGRYEQATSFLDQLGWPTSVLPSNGGVFICAAPEILFARDTDGDGVADERRVVFTGFETSNVQGLVNGLAWGPDGWIYGAGGGNGGEIRSPTRPGDAAVSIRGRDFRFKLDGSAFEVISGGGQFGHTFDDWGHRFVCNNSQHIRQVVLPARALDRNPDYSVSAVLADIGVEGAAAPVFRVSAPEPWRVVRTRQRAADPDFVRRLPPTELVATGFFTSATGITVYRGSAFPEQYRGNVFIGDVGGNLVHRKRLEFLGPEFRAVRADEGREFLASTDNWFRPVNFANTPRGTLLVLDMYRETIEHPASIPDPIKAHLDLTSGKDRGRIYELVPEGFRPAPRFNLETATTAELVNLLSHPDGWWRETAQRLLIEQHDRETVPMLRNVLASTHSALGRAHAVWTLHALGALTASDAISLAADREPRLRELAAKILAPFAEHDGAAEQALVTLASDDDRGVVFEAAITLGDLVGERPLNAFAAIARSHPANAWVRAAVLSGLRGRAGGLAANLRADGFFQSRAGAEWLAGLAPLVGAQRDNAQVAEFVRQLTETGVDEPTRLGALLGIARGMARTGRTLGELEQSGVRAVIEQSTRDAARLAAGAEDDAARLLAIRYLGVAEAEDSSSVLEALLDQREPVSIQLEAVRALMGGAGAEATRLVLERWPSLSPIVRGEAIEQILGRSRNVDLVLDAIEGRAISPADFPAARRGALLEHRDAATRERARRLLSEGRGEGRLEVLARYQGSLKLPGEAERGRAVFQRVCATCHAVGGQGHSVGPDIATVAHGSNEELVNHILDPNREVAPAYVGYVVATSDGRTFTGVIAEESSNSITLKRAEGVTDVVARSMIEEIRSTEASIMPEGLENDLSTQDLADLLLYVHTLTPAATNAR